MEILSAVRSLSKSIPYVVGILFFMLVFHSYFGFGDDMGNELFPSEMTTKVFQNSCTAAAVEGEASLSLAQLKEAADGCDTKITKFL